MSGCNHFKGTGPQVVRTDPRLLSAVRQRFGELTCDVAACCDNTVAPLFITAGQDALVTPWDSGLNWCNPPFRSFGKFTARAHEHAIRYFEGYGVAIVRPKVVTWLRAALGLEKRMQLRDYQRRTLNDLYRWMSRNTGNPAVVLPTGAGKSVCIAALCSETIAHDNGLKILVLCRQKELIEQNSSKFETVAPDVECGIYSAGLGRKEVRQVTFASVQSIARNLDAVEWFDVAVVDECHQEGGQLRSIVDAGRFRRVVGWTATPYRLKRGMITDGDDAIYSDIIEPVSIVELVANGYLSRLTSPDIDGRVDVSDVPIRGGDYVESALQDAVNYPEQNRRIAADIVARAGDRMSWILFCAGVDHAKAMAAELLHLGVMAACVHGETPPDEREHLLSAYKDGRLRCLTNANVLTTGFDAPATDLIALVRPTKSVGLYVQMAGRGMRVADGKENCLVLDYAGIVREHGPITHVKPPSAAGKGTGEAPVKVCDKCSELVHTTCKVCPTCGFVWPAPEKRSLELHGDDIMGSKRLELLPDDWNVAPHRKDGRPDMLRIDYGADMWTERVTEYLCPNHVGYAGDKSQRELGKIFSACGAPQPDELGDVDAISESLMQAPPPSSVRYKMEGRFPRVLRRAWDKKWKDSNQEAANSVWVQYDDDIPF